MSGNPGSRRLVELDDDNRAYWTGGSTGALLIMRCQSCGFYLHPPGPICSRCGSRDVAATKVSGRGRVYTFTINYRAWAPELEVPYVLALVELEEQSGLHLPTNIIGCSPDSVTIGMDVEVQFEPVEDQFVPLFAPRCA